MIRLFACIAAIVLAGPVQALTCLPSGAARLFAVARDAEQTFMVVRGVFSPRPQRPPTVVEGEDGYSEWRGRLLGRSLGPKGFSLPFDTEITLRGECLGAWCVAEPPQGPFLAFVEMTETGPVLTTDSCSRGLLRAPTREDLRTIIRCQKGGECEPTG